jgi:lauroyl/myristoyl acyltransferase
MELGYFFYNLGKDISIALPRRFVYKIASVVSDLHYYISYRQHKSVLSNLRLIRYAADEKCLRNLHKQIFRNFAKNLVDFFRFGCIDSRFIRKDTNIKGLEHVDSALRKGKGVLVVTAHLGNWELGGVLMAQKGYSMNAVAWEHKDRRIKDMFIYQRVRKGIKVISLGVALRKCYRALENNEIVAMVGDRDFSEQGMKVKVRFFGKNAWVPRGPAVLSLRTGATIVMGFTIREKRDSFSLIFEKPIEYIPEGNAERDIQILTQKILENIERFVRNYPEQWFAFSDFWANTSERIVDKDG